DTAMQIGALLDLSLLLATNRERVLLHLDGEVLLAETGDRHADAILVLADALDVVRRVARSVALEGAKGVEQRAEAVEADGCTIKWGKIKAPHVTSSLRSDMLGARSISSRACRTRASLEAFRVRRYGNRC